MVFDLWCSAVIGESYFVVAMTEVFASKLYRRKSVCIRSCCCCMVSAWAWG